MRTAALLLWLGPLAEPTLVRDGDVDRVATHAQTELEERSYPAGRGTVEIWQQELFGLPIAGARVAVRRSANGEITRLTGQLLEPDLAVPRRAIDGAQLWWPTEDGLIPARRMIEDLEFRDGQPVQDEVFVDLRGHVLARESLVDDIGVELTAWSENPTTTPDPFTQTVELVDGDPLRLRDELVTVVQCEFNEMTQLCDLVDYPTLPLDEADQGFSEPLPPLDDAEAHADGTDPVAGIASMLYAAQFSAELLAWGWDPAVWDEINCAWQEVEPEDCRLFIHANTSTEEGPLDGAFYTSTGRVFMGQGLYADASYDMGVLVHEYGHHVTRGFGAPPQSTDPPDDRSLLYTDRGAINEGTSDLFAALLTPSDELYVYFRNFGGLYQGVRTRDVGIDFACPENLVGELHMEGRIWVSTLHDLHDRLIAEQLGSHEDFGRVFLIALAQIRQIPRDRSDHFTPAAQIIADEFRLELGDQAGDLASELLEERGLIDCQRLLDIRDEATFSGDAASDDPLEARFLYLDSYGRNTEDEVVQRYPRPPAVQHTITLDQDESGVVLRFVPDRWRTRKRVDAPLDQDGIEVGLLVKALDGTEETRILFTDIEDDSVDPPVIRRVNDADFEFRSEVDPDRDGTWFQIVADGLEPGQSYALAVVSFTQLDGFDILVDSMEWSAIPRSEDAGAEGEIVLDDGCNCSSATRPTSALGLLVLLGLGAGRRRRLG